MESMLTLLARETCQVMLAGEYIGGVPGWQAALSGVNLDPGQGTRKTRRGEEL